jgi:hypothetical protein
VPSILLADPTTAKRGRSTPWLIWKVGGKVVTTKFIRSAGGRCYNINVLPFLPISSEKIGVFLKTFVVIIFYAKNTIFSLNFLAKIF